MNNLVKTMAEAAITTDYGGKLPDEEAYFDRSDYEAMIRAALRSVKIAIALRKVRWRRDLTQSEVAAGAKWPSTRLAVLEGAVHGFGIDMLERWCAGLGVQITVAVRYVNTNGDVKVHSFTHGELKNEH